MTKHSLVALLLSTCSEQRFAAYCLIEFDKKLASAVDAFACVLTTLLYADGNDHENSKIESEQSVSDI